MVQDRDLRAVERRAFRASFDDGLWDVLLASVLAMLAVGPLLSGSLGDFWSSAIFLPVWGGIYAAIWAVRRRVLAPRLGTVRLGVGRRERLRALTLVMLIVNIGALVLGAVAAFQGPASGWMYALGLGLVVLVLLSVAAYFLGIWRFFLYGVLLAIAAIIGEWLWREALVTHHGYPVMFGAAAGVIAVVGLVRFFLLLHRHGHIPDEPSFDVHDR